MLGKSAVKLLLILPCHAFKFNIFWATHNEKLKPFKGISETRYTKKIICQDVRKAPLEEKNVIKLRGTGYYCCSAYYCLEELEKQGGNVHFLSCTAPKVPCSSNLATRINAAKKQEDKEKPSFHSDPAAASGPC